MEEQHLNRRISVNKDGRLCIDNQEVDSDMILFEEEAKILLEQELMEGPYLYYPMEDDETTPHFDKDQDINDRDSNYGGDDIFFRDGYFDISNDDNDAIC